MEDDIGIKFAVHPDLKRKLKERLERIKKSRVYFGRNQSEYIRHIIGQDIEKAEKEGTLWEDISIPKNVEFQLDMPTLMMDKARLRASQLGYRDVHEYIRSLLHNEVQE